MCRAAATAGSRRRRRSARAYASQNVNAPKGLEAISKSAAQCRGFGRLYLKWKHVLAMGAKK